MQRNERAKVAQRAPFILTPDLRLYSTTRARAIPKRALVLALGNGRPCTPGMRGVTNAKVRGDRPVGCCPWVTP